MTRLAEVKAERDKAIGETRLLESALQLVLTSKPDATDYLDLGWENGPKERYVYELYGACKPHGGIVIEWFICDSQAEHVQCAGYLDNLPVPRATLGFQQVAERLKLTRNRLVFRKL